MNRLGKWIIDVELEHRHFEHSIARIRAVAPMIGYNSCRDVYYDIEAKLNGPKTLFEIKKVIFNDPATIVLWKDGTKTIVKCQDGDVFDPEKGLAMAISKKALGNTGKYFDEIKKWTEPELEMGEEGSSIVELFEELSKLHLGINLPTGDKIKTGVK